MITRLRTRLRDEGGFTLAEQVIVSAMMIVILSATLLVLDQSNQTTKRNADQNDAQDQARFTIDSLSKQLRNLAKPTTGSPNSIDSASSYNIVFKTADPGRRRVRYCVKTTAPYSTENGALYKQLQTVSAAGAADPAVPSTATCPGTVAAGGWSNATVVANHVTNLASGNDRPLFVYNAPTSQLSSITDIRMLLFQDVNTARAPAETKISTGVYLRNQNQLPTVGFTATGAGGRRFLMNGSASSDPEGRTLGYYWFIGTSPVLTNAVSTGACNGADGCVGSGITLDYTSLASYTPAAQTFTLLVVDPGGLNRSTSTSCTVSTGACSPQSPSNP